MTFLLPQGIKGLTSFSPLLFSQCLTGFLALSWRRSLSYKNQIAIIQNQWTGFYMIRNSVLKELMHLWTTLDRETLSNDYANKDGDAWSPLCYKCIINPFAPCDTDLATNSNKHYLNKNLFKRVLDKFSNDNQVDRLCTCGSLIIDV